MTSLDYNQLALKGLSSVIGASIAEIITLPICTIKTNYQVFNNNSSMTDIIKQIYQKEGLKGFYGASKFAVSAQALSTGSKFTFYQLLKLKRKTKNDDLFNNVLNGMIAGIAGSLLAHPIDVMKNSYQRDKQIFNEIKTQGYLTLYRGYSRSIYKNLTLYGLLFPLYDKFKTLNNGNILMSTVMTTTTTCVILQPIDYFRTKYMAGDFEKTGFNLRKFYKGFTLNLTRSWIHFSITMMITENLYNYLSLSK
jgi:hypothetical protein